MRKTGMRQTRRQQPPPGTLNTRCTHIGISTCCASCGPRCRIPPRQIPSITATLVRLCGDNLRTLLRYQRMHYMRGASRASAALYSGNRAASAETGFW